MWLTRELHIHLCRFCIFSDRGQCCYKIDVSRVAIQPEGGPIPSSLYFQSLVFLLCVAFSCLLLALISSSCFLSDGGGAGTIPQGEHRAEAENHTTATETEGNCSWGAQRDGKGMECPHHAAPTEWHWWGQNTGEALIWANSYFKGAVSKDQESLWSVGTKTQNFQACNQLRVFIFLKNPVVYAWAHIVKTLTEQWGKCWTAGSCPSLKSGNTWPKQEQHVGYHLGINRMT